MSATIKDVAEHSGVSIATVSHVINKTRYVSPELVERVEKAIKSTGYAVKKDMEKNKMHVGKQSIVAFLVPNVGGTVYSRLTASLFQHMKKNGYMLGVFFTGDDIDQEQHIISGLLSDRTIAGIILAPASSDPKKYTKLLKSSMPFVCLERSIKSENVDAVVSDNISAFTRATKQLVKSGHEKIGIILEKRELTTVEERKEAYRDTLEQYNLPFMERLVGEVDLYDDTSCEEVIRRIYNKDKPTAFIAGGNRLTLMLLRALQNMGLECPRDVSVIGFGDEDWCELAAPPLTTLKQNTEEMGRLAAQTILDKINGADVSNGIRKVPVDLSVRKSTQMIGRGPFGEKAILPEEISFTEADIEKLRQGDYKVCISFHYSGTAWAKLHEEGIRSVLDKYGIKVVSVSDAHFDSELQISQLEGMNFQNPDAIIAIPVDDQQTADKFREISKERKLIFISTAPEGFKKDEYASCVSVNERENGHNAGIMLGEVFRDKEKAKVGFLNHGAPFYGTHLRDMVARQTVEENYPNIEVTVSEDFIHIKKAYDVCKKMLAEHPELEGLYISWDIPALEAFRAIKEAGRTDLKIITFDLDFEIASYLAENEMVVGLSTQRPYEQGAAVGMAAAKALLDESGYSYIGVPPYTVTKSNLPKAWREVNKEILPKKLEEKLHITR